MTDPKTPGAEPGNARTEQLVRDVRAFLRGPSGIGYMRRKDAVDLDAYLRAVAFNYICGMSRVTGVTLQDLVKALAAADDEIEKLTGGAS